jgi:hypothetical protein
VQLFGTGQRDNFIYFFARSAYFQKKNLIFVAVYVLKQEKDVLKQEKDVQKQEKDVLKQEKDVLKQEMKF